MKPRFRLHTALGAMLASVAMLVACPSPQGDDAGIQDDDAGTSAGAQRTTCDDLALEGSGIEELDPRVARFIAAEINFSACCFDYGAAQKLWEVIEPGSTPPSQGEMSMADMIAALSFPFESPNVGIDEDALEACTLHYENDPCPHPTQVWDFEAYAPCQHILIGDLDEGEVCALGSDCKGGTYCSGEYSEGCGVCAPYAQLGERCDDVNCDRAAGLAESWASDTPTPTCVCVFPRGEGESCWDEGSGPLPCAADLQCYGDVCMRPRGEGEVCKDLASHEYVAPCATVHCDGDTGLCSNGAGLGESCGTFCQAGLDCDLASYTCVERTKPEEGSECSIAAYQSCGNIELTALYCDPTSSTCKLVEAVPLGEACDENLGRYCLHGYTTTYCRYDEANQSRTCVPRALAGEACGYGIECEHTAYCHHDDGGEPICRRLPTEGEHCTGDYLCAPGLSCDVNDTCAAPVDSFAEYRSRLEMCWAESSS